MVGTLKRGEKKKMLKLDDKVLFEGKAYYVTDVFDGRYKAEPLKEEGKISFTDSDIGKTITEDKKRNEIRHGLYLLMDQNCYMLKSYVGYTNLYGIYKERLYRIPSKVQDYWKKRADTDLMMNAAEQIYDAVSYNKEDYRLPCYYHFWIRLGKTCNGMKLSEIKKKCLEDPTIFLTPIPKPAPHTFIVSVKEPKFRRYMDNPNSKTFDLITIEILLRVYSENSIELCREHQKELIEAAIQKLEASRTFLRYNVPVNFLKIYEMTLTRDHCVRISFELKDIFKERRKP